MLTAWRDCASVTPIRCSLTRVNKKANSRLGGRTDTGRWTSTVLCLLLFRLHYSVSMQCAGNIATLHHVMPALCAFCATSAVVELPSMSVLAMATSPTRVFCPSFAFALCAEKLLTQRASTVVASMCIFNVCRSMFAAFIGNRTLTKRPFQGSCLFIFLFSEAQTRNTSLLGWVSKQIGNPA